MVNNQKLIQKQRHFCLEHPFRLYSFHSTPQLTAFAFRDYVRFGFVDQSGTSSTRLLLQFNINTYAPTMLLFKEDTVKPVDIIQVHQEYAAA